MEDSSVLERDCIQLSEWYNINILCLNIRRRKPKQFTKRKSKDFIKYTLNDNSLGNTHLIYHLGIYFNSKLTFDHQM